MPSHCTPLRKFIPLCLLWLLHCLLIFSLLLDISTCNPITYQLLSRLHAASRGPDQRDRSLCQLRSSILCSRAIPVQLTGRLSDNRPGPLKTRAMFIPHTLPVHIWCNSIPDLPLDSHCRPFPATSALIHSRQRIISRLFIRRPFPAMNSRLDR